MAPEILMGIALVSLGVTSIASIGARSLREFSRRELEELCRKRKSDLKFSEILRYDDQVAISLESLHVVTTAIFVTSATLWAYGTGVGAESIEGSRFVICALSAAGALLMFKIWIPWAVVGIWATPILFHSWRLLRIASQLLWPLVLLARGVETFIHRLTGRVRPEATEELFEEEIRSIVSEGHREGLLEEDEREMIEGVMELSDLDVAKAMTPRTDVVMVSVHLPWSEAIDFVIQAGHSRIPVFDKNRDDVIGMLHVKDLLPLLARDADPPLLNEVLRKPYFVPETKRLDDLLEEFQKARNHMAVVLDEYGGVSGLVTIEDVLEEIVGEIVDEYDEEIEDEIHEIDNRTIDLLARVHVDDINERFSLDLPDDGDFDTIGGFVFSQLGHIPLAGEEIVWNGARICVVQASRRRIERIRIVLSEPRRETA